jgi:hypothetical protein
MNHPGGSTATRKRILRAVLKEVIVTMEPGQLRLKLHWQGGEHSTFKVVHSTFKVVIASVLNRIGVRAETVCSPPAELRRRLPCDSGSGP